MMDLISGLGVALVIEGLLWALFPGAATAFLLAAARTPELTLRFAGFAAAGAGVVLVWLVRG